MLVELGLVEQRHKAMLEGRRAWRDARSDGAELFLRAVGIPAEEAQSIATGELWALHG